MPVHNWMLVEAGIFHAFHHRWISAISDALKQGILPSNYYALPEQHAAGFGPDVLTLQGARGDQATVEGADRGSSDTAGSAIALALPKLEMTAETDMEFYRRKQNVLVVRHVSGDRVVAMIEIISPGNKSTRHAFRSLIEKAAGEESDLPDGKPLTVAAYESTLSVRAYVRHLAVGDLLPEMPLFLDANLCVMVPLEETYQLAFAAQPARWRQVLAK